MKVSIIIPTYKEWHLLVHCIDALEKQTYPKEDFEVIIVNNDPNSPPPDKFFLPVNYKIITEAKPGSYAARNTGLRVAKGEIIGFTDSDCLPEKDWIKNAVTYLQNNKDCSRVAGEIAIIQKGSTPTIVESYNKVYSFPQKWLIKNGGGSITGNLFTYKYVFDKAGYFDEELMSMGDKYWGMMAQKAGFKVDYVDNVVVYHPARNFMQLVKKEKRHGGAVQVLSDKNKILLYLNFLYQFRPRLSGITFLFGKTKGLRVIDRITIPLLRHYLIIIRAYESMKVQMGKKPNRA